MTVHHERRRSAPSISDLRRSLREADLEQYRQTRRTADGARGHRAGGGLIPLAACVLAGTALAGTALLLPLRAGGDAPGPGQDVWLPAERSTTTDVEVSTIDRDASEAVAPPHASDDVALVPARERGRAARVRPTTRRPAGERGLTTPDPRAARPAPGRPRPRHPGELGRSARQGA
jgi:hypothetical protein